MEAFVLESGQPIVMADFKGNDGQTERVIDHATLNRWVVKFSPLIAANVLSRKEQTARSWRMEETYI
jgi:putative transposase